MKFYVQLVSVMFVMLTLTACGHSSDKEAADNTYHNVFLFSPETVTGDGETVKSFPAVVEEAHNTSVAFKTGGQIARILVREGDRVRAGQLLAVLDTVDYALGVNQLRVQYAQQQAEYERKKQMYASHNMSDNDFERATAGLHQLKLQLELNENKLKYCRLYAPASGVITRKNYERAEMVDAGTPVFELMDNNHLEVVVDLPVSNYMRHGEFTSFIGHTPHAPGIDIPLALQSITPKADNNQLYRMKLVMTSPVATLTPGMNLSVDITGKATAGEGAQVPLSAVFEREGKSAVWTFNPTDSTVSFTPVTVSGNGQDGTVTVTGGLAPGRSIVRAGAHHLTDGEKVKVITEGSDTNPGNLL